MKRTFRKWTSLTIACIMLAILLIPTAAMADGPRIDITSPKVPDLTTMNSAGIPLDLSVISRFTTSTISITASIQNISDAQVADIYYEITNIKSDPRNNVTLVTKSNPAIHTPGSFTITFNNVALTEGLNQITLKMGNGSIVSSAPQWAYFTPTTNITDLTVNTAPWVDSQSYPKAANPNSTVTISGKAINATSVVVTIGNSAPKTVFLSAGTGVFFFTADNKPKTTATFQISAGDNPITIVAKNSTKSYQVKKNLIYDDGQPYAFNANISTNPFSDDYVSVAGSISADLAKPNVANGSVEVWTGPGKTGTRINKFTLNVDATNSNNQSYLAFDPTLTIPSSVYVSYSYGNSPLLSTPTTTTTNVGITANLKDNLTSTGNLKYRFVDVIAGGKRFGPYDLTAAAPATTAFNNGLYPNSLNDNYSSGTLLGIQGSGLNSLGVVLAVDIADKSGTLVDQNLTIDTTVSTGTMAFFSPTSTLASSGSPYKVTIKNGTTVLNNYTLTVLNKGLLPQATVTAPSTNPKVGGLSTEHITLTGTTDPQTGSPYSQGSLKVTISDLTGQNDFLQPVVQPQIIGTDTDFPYLLSIPAGLSPGEYKIKVSYSNNELINTVFTIDPADPLPPTVVSTTRITVPIPDQTTVTT
ncbi:MAG: S-layer protein, partial [Bacilli bacterium]|nr:S-layer protein [Bacilli bacterium]